MLPRLMINYDTEFKEQSYDVKNAKSKVLKLIFKQYRKSRRMRGIIGGRIFQFNFDFFHYFILYAS